MALDCTWKKGSQDLQLSVTVWVGEEAKQLNFILTEVGNTVFQMSLTLSPYSSSEN